VADEIGKLTGRKIDRRTVEISEPLRQVGLHSVSVRLHSDVIASVNVLVYPIGSDPEEFLASWTAQQEQSVEGSEDGSTETAAQAEDAGGEPDAVAAEEAGDKPDAVVAEEADGGSSEGD
jgi:large subunit ribosomal protein L9